jgi:hypothetical protein
MPRYRIRFFTEAVRLQLACSLLAACLPAMGTWSGLEWILPLRVSLLLAYLILVLCVFHVSVPLVAVTLNPWSSPEEQSKDFDTKSATLKALLGLTLVFLAVECLGLVTGATLFLNRLHATSIALHSFGVCFLLMMVLNGWGSSSYTWIFFTTVVPSGVMDGLVLLQQLAHSFRRQGVKCGARLAVW